MPPSVYRSAEASPSLTLPRRSQAEGLSVTGSSCLHALSPPTIALQVRRGGAGALSASKQEAFLPGSSSLALTAYVVDLARSDPRRRDWWMR